MSTFAWDTETDLIRPGLLAPPLVCVSCIREGDDDYALWDDQDGLAVIEGVLGIPECHIVGHNVAYDFGVVAAARPDLIPKIFEAYEQGRVSDTRIREKLIRIARGEMSSDFAQAAGAQRQAKFDLASIFKHRFDIDLSAEKNDPTAWRTRYGELLGVPVAEWPEAARKYAGEDAIRHLVLYQEQRKDAAETFGRDDGFITNEHEQAAAAWALHLMGIWGVRTDGPAVTKLDVRLQQEVAEAISALTDFGIIRAKDGSKDMKKLGEVIRRAYEAAGAVCPTTAGRLDKKTGIRTPAIATDKDTLTLAPTSHQPKVVLAGKEVPVLQALAGISEPEHNRATYIPAMLAGIGQPINPGWNELVESGRTSAFKPNLQNLPRKGGYRECFIPRKGWVFINTDYSTVELCALAQVNLTLFGYSKMAEALVAGKDLHLDMAAEILGLTYDEVKARKKDPIVKDHRQMSKALNFGFPGGLGPETAIAYARTAWNVTFDPDPEVAVRKVKGYKNKWLGKWTEMQDFFGMVSALTAAGGGQAQIQQVGSGRLRGGVGFCDGCNTFFQGLAADGAKAALFYIQQECYTGYSRWWTREEHGDEMSPLYGCRMTIFVHDEFIGEAPEWKAAEAAERLSVVAKKGMELYITDVPIIAEPVLMRRWYKNAETVRDEAGRLICWEPEEAA